MSVTSAMVRHLEENASRRPEALAVRTVDERGGERVFCWRELRCAAAAVADRVAAPGGAGTVIVSGTNGFELFAAILGGLWAGARVAPVAAELTATELRALAKAIDATAVLGAATALDALASRIARAIPLTEAADPQATAPTPSGAGDGSILLRSSGTTGPPKVVRRDAAALDAMGRASVRAIGMDEGDTILLAIPVYHSYGIDQAVCSAPLGGCAVELHERFDLGRVRRSIASGRVTIFPAVPVMLDALARFRNGGSGAASVGAAVVEPGERGAPGLRRVFSAGSPLPASVASAFWDSYGLPVGQIYGASEFGSATFNDPDLPGYDPESVGRSLDGVELRVLDLHAPRVDEPLPPGREGQLAVAAPSMMSEYVDDPSPPTEAGFLLSGDLGRIDEQGRLFLTGRLKLLVDVGGQKVNPLEVESVLLRHPDVAEVVVVPVPYTQTAWRIKAIIVPEPGRSPTRQEIRRFASEHLIHYKVPRSFEIRSDLPRSPTGKILRQALMPGAPAR